MLANRFEFSGQGPRPPQARVRWNELLGSNNLVETIDSLVHEFR